MKKIRDLFGPVLLVTVLLSGAYATPKPADAGVVTDAQTDAGTNPPKTVDAIDSGVLTEDVPPPPKIVQRPPPPPLPVLTKPQLIALAQIETLEAARRTERSTWRRLLKKEDSLIVREAVRSIGRVQSLDLLGLLQEQLASKTPEVRSEAAFAYGQVKGASSAALIVRLAVEKDEAVRVQLVAALGRLGGPSDVTQLVFQATGNESRVRAAALVALAKIAHRTAVPLAGLDAIWDRFPRDHHLVSVRHGWAYLAMRARKNVSPTILGQIEACLKDAEPEVRAACARALGRFGESGMALRRGLINDPDWRVQVSGVRADLQALDDLHLATRLERLAVGLESEFDYNSPAVHVALATIDALMQRPVFDTIQSAEGALFKATLHGPAEPFNLGKAHLNCGASALRDRRKGRPRLTLTCGSKAYPAALRSPWEVKVTSGLSGRKRVKALVRMYRKLDTSGKISALEAFVSLPQSKRTQGMILDALMGKEPALAGTAATVGARLKIPTIVSGLISAYSTQYEQRAFEAVQAIFGAMGALAAEETHAILNRHSDDSHPGVRQAARAALKSVDGAIRRRAMENGGQAGFLPGRRSFLPPPAESFESQVPDTQIVKVAGSYEAIIQTTKGTIAVRLKRTDARETVKNFVSLIGRGFYNNLLFHRVVPGFIVQTGDPKGSGWGGPGYAIPCETHPTSFVRGTVGMALTGRDTGGSQFFITQGPAPHLDGRYTAFGQVVQGLEVVDSITVGDRILSVELRSDR